MPSPQPSICASGEQFLKTVLVTSRDSGEGSRTAGCATLEATEIMPQREACGWSKPGQLNFSLACQQRSCRGACRTSGGQANECVRRVAHRAPARFGWLGQGSVSLRHSTALQVPGATGRQSCRPCWRQGRSAPAGTRGRRTSAAASLQRSTRQATRAAPPVLPNPSFKPSPNSKTPGPRCSVGVHFLQRGPGVLLPVPA